jgi:CDP-6-deoxy-D-xylo-4-hexulose-3-dehydrase
MENNILREDIDDLIKFLQQDPIPFLTQSRKVRDFEAAWGQWLGTRFNVFCNSGSSANQLTFLALKERHYNDENIEVIVPPLTWVSDIAAVLQNGFKPVFADINLKTLALDVDQVRKKITKDTRYIFLTHVLGYNGLSQDLISLAYDKKLKIIEDVCESHGATFGERKCGSMGHISNFSFYWAHHMSTIEGGMVCTNDETIYNLALMFRSHGMLREADNDEFKREISAKYPDLNSKFIFTAPAYNMRSTEINAVLGLSQLKRLNENNKIRAENLAFFLENLDGRRFFKDFDQRGNSNYAFTLLLKKKDYLLRNKIEEKLNQAGIEFRRGMSGGGNQLRQPYLRRLFGNDYINYPNAEMVHFYGWYIGNYPTITKDRIKQLTDILNS